MKISDLADALDKIVSVSVTESGQNNDSEFSVCFVVEETEIGWIALESISRMADQNDCILTSHTSDKIGSLYFRLTGQKKSLPPAHETIKQIVMSESEHAVFEQ